MIQRYLNPKDAAKYLGVSVIFLARARSEGVIGNRTPGPPYSKIGKCVRYRLDDLDQWMAEHRREHA